MDELMTYSEIRKLLSSVCQIRAKALESWIQIPEFRTEIEKIIIQEQRTITIHDVIAIMESIKWKAINCEEYYPGFLLNIGEYEYALEWLYESIAASDPANADLHFLYNICLSISQNEISAWFVNPIFCKQVREAKEKGIWITERVIHSMMQEAFFLPQDEDEYPLSGRKKRYKHTMRKLDNAIANGSSSEELSFVYSRCRALSKPEISDLLRDRRFSKKILEYKNAGILVSKEQIASILEELIGKFKVGSYRHKKYKKLLRRLQESKQINTQST